MEHVLGPGEARRVDNGHLVAWTDHCAISPTAGSSSIVAFCVLIVSRVFESELKLFGR